MENKVFKYKTYRGSIEPDLENGVLYGKILFIADLVTYEADSLRELENEFKAAVDDYLETCRAIGKDPAQSFSGTFNVRIGPSLHRKAAMAAYQKGLKLNEFVKDAIKGALTDNTQHVAVHIHPTQVVHEELTFKHPMGEQKWELIPPQNSRSH